MAHTDRAGTVDLPTSRELDRIVADARALFRRTLAGWASDMLQLRRRGLDRPQWTFHGTFGPQSMAA